MKEMKTFEPNLLDNKTMHGVYYNEYCLCRKLSNNSPEQLLILCTRLNTAGTMVVYMTALAANCCRKTIVMLSRSKVNQ